MKLFRLIVILWVSASSQPCFAGTVTQKKGGVALEVHYDGDARRLALSDLLTVTLTVEGTPLLRTPLAPLELPAAAPWKVEERTKPSRESIRGNRVRWQIIYRVSPQQPGKAIAFQFPDVKFRAGDEDEQTVTWAPIPFEVVTQITLPDRSALRDITAIEVPLSIASADPSWLPLLMVIGAGVVLCGLAIGLRVLFRRKIGRSPAQLALYELQRLIAMKLPEKEQSEPFVTLLTMLVRRYLERQFALPARRLTTPEFIRDLEQFTMLTAPEREFLTTFLQRCDAIKFANQVMSSQECARWASATREFLQRR